MQKTSTQGGGAANAVPSQVEAAVDKELAEPASKLDEQHASMMPSDNAVSVTQTASSSQSGKEAARPQLKTDREEGKDEALAQSASGGANNDGPLEEQTAKKEEVAVSAGTSGVWEQEEGGEDRKEQGQLANSAEGPQVEDKVDNGQINTKAELNRKSTSSCAEDEGSTRTSLQDALEATEKSIMAVFHDLKGYTAEPNESEAARKVIEAATAGVAAAIESIHAAKKLAGKVMIGNEEMPGQKLPQSLSQSHGLTKEDPHHEARKVLAAMQAGIIKQSQQASATTSRPSRHDSMEGNHHYEARKALAQMQAGTIEQFQRPSSSSDPHLLVEQQVHPHQSVERQADHYTGPKENNAASAEPPRKWLNGAVELAKMLGQEVGQLSPTQRLMGNDAVTKWHQEAVGRRPGLRCTMEHAQRRDWSGSSKLGNLSPIHPIEQELSYHRSLHNAPPQQKTEVNFMMLLDGVLSKRPSQARQSETGIPLKTMLRCTLDEEKSKNVSSAEPWETWSSQELRRHRL